MLPASAARVVAFLALHYRVHRRSYVAGQLWPDVAEHRARANLRNAVWKANTAATGLIQGSADIVRLSNDVAVDVAPTCALAEDLVLGRQPLDATTPASLFSDELLLGWDDDWALFERERIKQLCLHALESLSLLRLGAGAHAAAIDAALLAVKLEPLRESSHRAISNAHLAEGNVAQARRQFDLYARLLDIELGLAPSPEYRELFERFRTDSVA
jgi:DNA-binding SARP family transcriptional activator